MSEKSPQPKSNIAERGLRFLRNVHIGLGAAALGGAVLFPQAAFLAGVAGYEGVNAGVHEGLRQLVKERGSKRAK